MNEHGLGRPSEARRVGTVKRIVADDGSVEVWQITRVGRPPPDDTDEGRLKRIKGHQKWLQDNREQAERNEPYEGATQETIDTLGNDIEILKKRIKDGRDL